jgi:hypothetical protein
MKRKFFVDSPIESDKAHLIPHHLSKRDAFEKYNVSLFMVAQI